MSSPTQLKPAAALEPPQGEGSERESPRGKGAQRRYTTSQQNSDRKWINRYDIATFRGTRKCPKCLARRPGHAVAACTGEEAKPKNQTFQVWHCKYDCGLYFPRGANKCGRAAHGKGCPKNSDPGNAHYVSGFDKFGSDDDGYFTCPQCGDDGFYAHDLATHLRECDPMSTENPYSDGHQGFECEDGCGWFRTRRALALHLENCGCNIGPVHLGMDQKLPNIYNITYTQFAISMGWTVAGTKRVPQVVDLQREAIHACQRVPENLLWHTLGTYEISVAQLLTSQAMERNERTELVRGHGIDLSRKLRTKLQVSQVPDPAHCPKLTEHRTTNPKCSRRRGRKRGSNSITISSWSGTNRVSSVSRTILSMPGTADHVPV